MSPDVGLAVFERLIHERGAPPLVEDLLARPGWQSRAACRSTGPAPFFPTDENVGVEAARALCRTCDVLDDCFRFALARSDLSGIWAGTSERQRQRMRRELRRPAAG